MNNLEWLTLAKQLRKAGIDVAEIDSYLTYSEAIDELTRRFPSLRNEDEWIREAIHRNRLMRDLKYGDLFKGWRRYRRKQNPFKGWVPLKSVHQIR